MKKLSILLLLIMVVNSNSQSLTDFFYRLDSDYYDAVFLSDTAFCIVGSNGGAVTTTDNGKNWIRNNSNTSNSLVSVSFEPNTKTTFAVGYNGIIIKSTNSGQDWETLDIGTENNLTSISFSNNIGFITGNKGELYKSADNGNSWLKIDLNTLKNLKKLERLNSGRVIIADSTAGIYLSDDNFNTWKSINLSGEIIQTAAREIDSKDDFVVIRLSSGFLTLYDAGENWEYKSLNSKIIQSVEILDKNKLLSIIRQEGGDTYQFVNLFEINLDNEAILTEYEVSQHKEYLMFPAEAIVIKINPFSENRKALIIGENNTISFSSDSLKTWEPKSVLNFINSSPIYFLDKDYGFLASLYKQIYKTENGGATWLPQKDTLNISSLPYSNIIHLHFDDKLNGTAFQNQEKILVTNDGGLTYKNANEKDINPRNIISYSKDIFCLQDYSAQVNENGSNVYSRINFENLETKVSNEIYIDSFNLFSGIFITPEKIMFFGLKYDTLYVKIDPIVYRKVTYPVILITENFGKTFEIKKINLNITSINSLYYFSESNLLFLNGELETDSGYIYSVYKSTDFGENWKLILERDSMSFGSININLDGSGMLLSVQNGILLTNDFGDTWEVFRGGLDKNYKIINWFCIDNTIYLKTDNGLYKSLPGKFLPTSVNGTEITEEGPPPVWLFPPYPNPAKGRISFSLLWDKRINVTDIKIEIFDITGIKLKDISDTPKLFELDNKATLTIQTDELPNGIYYLRVQYQDYIKTAPIVVWHQ